MDAYPDLCDTLAAHGQQHYSEVRDFFLSRAAEKAEKKDEEKAQFVPSRNEKRNECTWYKKRGFRWDNHNTSKCHKMNKEKRKGRDNKPTHAASAATDNTTFTILAATNQSGKSDTWLCDSGASKDLSPFVERTMHLHAGMPGLMCDCWMDPNIQIFSTEPCMFPRFDTPWFQSQDSTMQE